MKQLHITLLVISLVCMVLFVLMLYRPHIKRMHRDTKAVVNMLSQLPNEVDAEGQLKSVVLGITKAPEAAIGMITTRSSLDIRAEMGCMGGPGGHAYGIPQSAVAGMRMMVPAGGAGPAQHSGACAGWGGAGNGGRGGWFARGSDGAALANDVNAYGGYGAYNSMAVQQYGNDMA